VNFTSKTIDLTPCGSCPHASVSQRPPNRALKMIITSRERSSLRRNYRKSKDIISSKEIAQYIVFATVANVLLYGLLLLAATYQ
jgi:hypothetical protein